MSPEEVIKRLPWETRARLLADQYLAQVPVIVAEEGNVKLEMERIQGVTTVRGGKRGIAIIVLQQLLSDDQPGLQFGPSLFRPALQVVENLTLNRGPGGTGLAARQVGRRIRDVFKGTVMTGLTTSWLPEQDYLIPVALPAELGANVKAYQVQFKCYEIADAAAQCATPQVTSLAPAPQVALSCATAGAVIWYTTDDSYPVDPAQLSSMEGPGKAKGTAQQYAGPITVDQAGFFLRAVTVAPGLIDSTPIRVQVSATQL